MQACEATGTSVFLGRQPIFDRRRQVFGYELLFRSNGARNTSNVVDGDAATGDVMNNCLNVMAWDELVGERQAFINMTRRLMIDQVYEVLPRDRAVVELLEDSGTDAEIVEACRRLKQAGYTLALDDFVYSPEYEPLLELADVIKVDFMALDAGQRAWHAERFGGRRYLLLAEKVETPADFEEAMRLGYTHFQGYFFCKPQIIEGREVPAVKRNYLRFLHEVNMPDLDFARLEQVIKQDVSLSAKLLRYLNSAAFGLRNKLTSIKQALVLLGQGPLRKWASLVATGALGADKPAELLITCLTRARFCELLGQSARMNGEELKLFLMGLFSALDALVDQPMEKLISQLPVPPEVTDALLGAESPLGRVYQLVLAYERGNAAELDAAAGHCGLAVEQVGELYWQAVKWADQVRV